MSREVAALFGLEGRTADGPLLGRGQSESVLEKSSREVVSLAWAERLYCGRSGPWTRTVRRSLNILTREVLGLWWDLRVKGGRSAIGERTVRRSVEKNDQRRFCFWWVARCEGRMVRSRGADGPPLKL